jgi:acetyltransferase-like isoleucine patch superfamily enzyme
MFGYQSIMYLYTRIYRRVWRILFGSRFKRFGKSSIIRPLKINGPKYIEIGDNVKIAYKGWLTAEKRSDCIPQLIIEDNTRIGHFSTISCVRDVRIGKNVLIADRVYISDNIHSYEDITLPVMHQPTIFKNSAYIGDDTWIGANVSIIGARVGKHCVIGANSVVTKDIPDFSVAIGSPASVIKRYNFETNVWQRTNNDGTFTG